MEKRPAESVSSHPSEADLHENYRLASEPGALVPPFFFRESDGGLALIRKLEDRYNLAFYAKTADGTEKVGEVTGLDELEDARVVAKEELLVPLLQPRSFRWAKLKDDLVLVDGEALSTANQEITGMHKRLPEGLLVKFVAVGSEPGTLVVEAGRALDAAAATKPVKSERFEISKRLLNLL